MISGPNAPFLQEIKRELIACGEAIDALLRQADARIEQAREGFEAQTKRLEAAHQEQEIGFRAVVEKHEAAMEQAQERAQLERMRILLQGKKRQLTDDLGKQADDLHQRREALMQRLSELRDQRFAVRQHVVGATNADVEPNIRVDLAQHGDTGDYCKCLAYALRHSNVKHQVVASRIASSVPPHELASLVRRGDWSSLAAQSGINAEQAAKVVSALNDQGVLFDVEIVDLDDQPAICLLDGGSYKDSQSLSTGQKCTGRNSPPALRCRLPGRDGRSARGQPRQWIHL